MSTKKNIVCKVWTRVVSSGDGSAFYRFFKTEQEAEDDRENDYEPFCDDVRYIQLEFTQDGEFVRKL